jgi:archaeosine synthase
MTKFYEVRKRDGAARIGQLQLSEVTQTPLMLSVEHAEELKELTVADSNFNDLVSDETWNAPRGAVLLPEVHPLYIKNEAPMSADFFVLAFASNMLNSPWAFVHRVINARNTIPPDVALWVPAIATAENAALLFYLGVDIIDNLNAVIKGYQGIYQMEEGELSLSEMEELPCNCSVCSSMSIDELMGREDRALLIAKHNELLLAKEVKKVTARIRAGNLREYVEMRARASTFLTAVLRIMDLNEEKYFELRTPVARKQCMIANTMESLKRIEVKRFANRVIERYEPPVRQILLLLPCSARKPYSKSRSHKKFIDAIGAYRGCIHELILTSPLGVVPRELEVVYPAAFYDIPVTGYWDLEEREWVASCLRAYLTRNIGKYELIVAHLGGAYKEICSSVADDMGIETRYTCEEGENATSRKALDRLSAGIAALGSESQLGFEQKASVIRAIADYQFGIGAGRELVTQREGERIKIRGKFPLYKLSLDGELIARIVPEYGSLALSISGARRISNMLASYTVEIGNFVPKGSVLAPGVVNANEQIRVNDEVIFCGAKAFGVGRAKMSGREMVESHRGAAVQVRAVEAVE